MSLGLAGYTGLNKNDESYMLSQGLHSVQTINKNPNTRIDNNNPSSPDPYYNSVYSVAGNPFNVMIQNSVIHETISDENVEEFFDYLSRHNHLAQQDVEGTANNVAGSYIIGSTINTLNVKEKLQSAIILKNKTSTEDNKVDQRGGGGVGVGSDAASGSNEKMIISPVIKSDGGSIHSAALRITK